MALRKAGISLEDIAAEVGYASQSGAAEAIKAALAKTLEAPAAELRQLTVARLDDLLASVWEDALAGDREAVATAIRIEEKRVRLPGIDKLAPPEGAAKVEKNEDAEEEGNEVGVVRFRT